MAEPPVLYSFRRCPYAMRARLAIAAAGAPVRLREIVLRDKPAEMLDASPKGTVPVLVFDDGRVLDESLDIMRWALAQRDPEGWLAADPEETEALIAANDGAFKRHLDRYKYPDRHPGEDRETHWRAALDILADWDRRLSKAGALMGAEDTLADFAVVPFVRQFAHVDRDAFAHETPPALQAWFSRHLASDRFALIMRKHPLWLASGEEVAFPGGLKAA